MADLKSETLDRLVLEYLSNIQGAQDGKKDETVRQLLLSGAFTAAGDCLRQLCPTLADNQWLQFQLKRQQFLHLASLSCTQAGDGSSSSEEQGQRLQEAIELARHELAPLALHAYCEAYQDFKSCMLALLSLQSSGSSSSAGASSAASDLREFAGVVARAVRRQVGCGDCQLPQLLRYLLLLHQHQHHSGFHPYWWPVVSSQTQQLCAVLLLQQQDALPPAALEPVDGGSDVLLVGGVREHDVQALRTSLGCDREEAVALLRRAKGSAFKALQDALQASHIDERLLAELAEEYAAWRGLDVPAAADHEGEAAADSASAEGMCVDGSDAAESQQEAPQQHQRRPCKMAKKGPLDGKQAAADKAAEAVRLELPAELSEQQLRQLLRQLERLLSAGQAESAIEQLQAAEPAFLSEHPEAAFALHRCRFLECLAQAAPSSSGTAAALAIVRQQLTPLAQQRPDQLQGQLKSALAMLLPFPAAAGGGEGAAASQKQQQQGTADAVAAVRTALLPRCNIKEPRLLLLLKELLSLHAAHFKLQRCQDKFAADLGISALKPADKSGSPAKPGGGAPAATAAAAMAAEAQQALAAAGREPGWVVEMAGQGGHPSESEDDEDMGEGESEEDDDGSDGTGVPEQAILTVCEFTGLPRHTAIDLLLAHGGDPAAVLIHVFP